MPSDRQNQTFQGTSFSVIVDLHHYQNVCGIHAKTTGFDDYFGGYAPSFQMIIISSDGRYKAQSWWGWGFQKCNRGIVNTNRGIVNIIRGIVNKVTVG